MCEISNEDSIIKWLVLYINGVGNKIATEIYNYFGKDTVTILMENPHVIRKLRLNNEVKRNIINFFTEEKEKYIWAEILVEILNMDVNEIVLAFQKIESEKQVRIKHVIKDNPYILLEYFQKLTFERLDKLAINTFQFPKKSLVRVEKGIEIILKRNLLKGHTFMELEGFYNKVVQLLDLEEDFIVNAVTELSSNTAIFEIHNDKVVVKKANRIEKEIAEQLYRLANYPINLNSIKFKPFNINQELNQIINNNISIITGKPGTGKTTLIKSITNTAIKEGLTVKLVAFSGKASQRLREATGYDATTIHYLLEYQKDKNFNRYDYKKKETNPIQADMLIVDETSMIDNELALQLLKAVPEGCLVIFVGDVNQLESIGAGSFFRDIIESQLFTHIELKKIHRQPHGSLITMNADRLLEGQKFLSPQLQNEFVTIDTEDIECAFHNVYYSLWQEGFHPLEDIQILTIYKKEEMLFGSMDMNNRLQRLLNPIEPSKPQIISKHNIFCLGDKVMQRENNRLKGVFNGDVGFIVGMDTEKQTIDVHFETTCEKVVTFSIGEIDMLDLGYACTVHKSQGSEYEVVILLVPSDAEELIMKNLIYTAITRAKRRVFIIGDLQLLYRKVFGELEEPRKTLLKKYLGEKFNDKEESIFGKDFDPTELEFHWN